MNYLARVELEGEAFSKASRLDSYGWHKRVWDCFHGEAEHARDFLSRIDFQEGGVVLWILAQRKPVCPSWCPSECFRIKEVSPSFLSHPRYVFDLKANPTKSLVQRGPNSETLLRTNGKRRHGKRAPLTEPDDLRSWIERKGIMGGFRIIGTKPLEIGPMVESHFCKQGMNGYHGGVQFKGTLEVTEPRKFSETYSTGLGSAKAFGFGLMLLRPTVD